MKDSARPKKELLYRKFTSCELCPPSGELFPPNDKLLAPNEAL